jgi:uncharacterized protein
MNLEDKINRLRDIIREMGEITVAYSGGVDSTFLLKVATDVLGENCVGVLAVSPTLASRERSMAIRVAESMGARLHVIETHELEDENFAMNPENRCYFCKSELFDSISLLSEDESYRNPVDGSNLDDMGDHRPGMKALKERNVRSPLREAGLTKKDIRALSKQLGLPTWNKDEMACLSSRFPYGERISRDKLRMVDLAEAHLSDMGFRNIRARHAGSSVMIEVDPQQVNRLMDAGLRNEVEEYLRSIGYTEIRIDPEGYRRGKMNDVLNKDDLPDPESLRVAT